MSDRSRRIAVVTGTRAEFGLLRPVMRAVEAHASLDLSVIVTGVHLLPPARTIDEVRREFDLAATVEMQRPGETGRFHDARSLGRGVAGLADAFEEVAPDVVVVLGDRVEAFAAASAASVAGARIGHIHGGDRAEGVADEAMRHAITKLAHIHLPATPPSAERIIRMGERPTGVHVVGSPSIDDLRDMPPLDDNTFNELGAPTIVFLMHPIGRCVDEERRIARAVLAACLESGPVLAVQPNHDPGREGIVRAIDEAGVRSVEHLPRDQFIGLLRRASVLVGNSSAGLIECAAEGARCVNVGPRQAGRDRPGNVIDVAEAEPPAVALAIDEAIRAGRWTGDHPYGDGRAGERIASVLASFEPDDHPLRKRNAY